MACSSYWVTTGCTRETPGSPAGGLGYVPKDKVIGEAFVIAWPLDRIGGVG